MKLNAVINRYILKEIFPPYILSIAFLLFIFLMTTMLRITDLVVNYRVGMDIVFWLMVYAIPFFLGFVLPMSSMLAILLAFLKMSSDNEIIALKASGISIYKLIWPVLFFCLFNFAATAGMTLFGVPWGKSATRALSLDLKTSSYGALLKERSFNQKFANMMVYVNKADPQTNTLTDIFIEDRNNRGMVLTVTAPRGQMVGSDEDNTFHLRLYEGTINQTKLANKSTHTIHFDTYDVRLDLTHALKAARNRSKDEEEMSFSELRHHLRQAKKRDRQYFQTLLEFHKKLSLPFACISLGILAIPLGLRSKSSKRSFGVGLGIIFFLMYYMMLAAAWTFGETGAYPPAIGMWVPNVVMGGLGLFLLHRSANERPAFPSGFLKRSKYKRRERYLRLP